MKKDKATVEEKKEKEKELQGDKKEEKNLLLLQSHGGLELLPKTNLM